MKSIRLIICLLTLVISVTVSGQANLTIVNNSQRQMIVKVMTESGRLYKKITIAANSSGKVYFETTGHYLTKSKASISGREDIYKKGDPFRVVNDDTGYSEMVLTFSIKESTNPISSGKTISKKEFDQE